MRFLKSVALAVALLLVPASAFAATPQEIVDAAVIEGKAFVAASDAANKAPSPETLGSAVDAATDYLNAIAVQVPDECAVGFYNELVTYVVLTREWFRGLLAKQDSTVLGYILLRVNSAAENAMTNVSLCGPPSPEA